MQNVILSQVSIPDLVNHLADELEKRLLNREQVSSPVLESKRLNGDKAAAEYLGCTPLTIQKLRKSGHITFYRYGRKYYYYSSQLDQELKVSQRQFGKGKKPIL